MVDFTEIFEDSYSKLNTVQKQAVDTTEGPVLVLAGPGTGKTQILAMRIANILRNPDLQVNPNNILCLTFTETGVTAMKERLLRIIGTDAYQVRVHTFHSFCNEVIKDNPELFPRLRSLTEIDVIQIVSKLIDKLKPASPLKPFGDPYYYLRDVISKIATLKKESIAPNQLQQSVLDLQGFLEYHSSLIEAFVERNARSIKEEEKNKFIEQIFVASSSKPEWGSFVALIEGFDRQSSKVSEFKTKLKKFHEDFGQKYIPRLLEFVEIYSQYLSELSSKGFYDFEDMILRVIDVFEKQEKVLARYQEQYQYILVDEYQDTNGSQSKVLQLLCSYYQANSNIFVVGDDDQSIYRFQGASLENIFGFHKRYKDYLSVFVLEQNYRSQQNILDLSSVSISNNKFRISNLIGNISKELKSSGSALEYSLASISLNKFGSRREEVFGIAQKISQLIESGVKANEIAVLFRGNKEVSDFVEIFSRLKIPYQVKAKDNILEDIYILQLIDLFRVILNPYSNGYLIFNLLHYGFVFESSLMSSASSVDILQANSSKRLSDKPYIEQLLDNPKFNSFAQAIIDLHREQYNLKLESLFEQVIHKFGYLSYVLKRPDYVQDLARLDLLFAELKKLYDSPLYSNLSSRLGLKEFVGYLDLLFEHSVSVNMDDRFAAFESVKLMTAHSSKGLEFEYVFLTGLVDKAWSSQSRDSLKLPPSLETQSLIDPDDDERRLFYVAMTRAKKEIYLSYFLKDNKSKDQIPSKFLVELQQSSRSDLIRNEQHDDMNLSAELLLLNFREPIDYAMDSSKDFIANSLQNYKMSTTHLQNYLDCPRKFLYQNLLRIPSAKQKHASLGTAVHKALCDLFRSKSFKERGSGEYLLKQFEVHLEEEHLPEKDHIESLEQGRNWLFKYYERYREEFRQDVLLEYDFSSLGINWEGINLTGKLDKIEILSETNVNVVDYKTGNPTNRGKDLKPGGDYYRQIAFYKLLCDLGLKSKSFKYQMSSGELDFIRADDSGVFRKALVVVTDEDLSNLKEEIKSVYQGIMNQEFEKTEDLQRCSICSYRNICGR